MATFTSKEGSDILAHYARTIMERRTDTLKEKPAPKPSAPRAGDSNVVGIMGAGVGGLYTAIMLQSLDVPFEIIEASDRVGGRLFTHKFEKGGDYDYFDVGAMRYPLPEKDAHGNYLPGVMQRVGQLFNFLGMQDKLIPYYYESSASPAFQYFNGVRARIGAGSSFNAPALGISNTLIDLGVSRVVEDVVGPFARMLWEDLQEHTRAGWEMMMMNDAYSMRSYMSFKYIPSASFGLPPDHLSTRVVNWCETFDNSTGAYSKALTETVLDVIAFGQDDESKVEWTCIDGGSHVLTDTMEAFLIDKVGTNAICKNLRVTSIGLEDPANDTSPMVVIAGGQERKYSHVISTLPLPVLRTVDLTKSNLDVLQQNSIRQLEYGPSSKIGILFTESWWTTGQDKDGEAFNIVGGQSFSDLPIRTVVYPSYGPGDSKSNTLIASYTWTSDAERLGALMGTGKQEIDDQLETLVLNNLATIHNVTYDYLKTIFVQLYAWDWTRDVNTMGAFAFFGPGNFQDMYTSLCRPAANDKLHFAGEALSVRHAWVVGALDSAWRAVYEYLYHTDPLKIPKFIQLWGTNPEWFTGAQFRDGDTAGTSLLERYLRRAHGTVFA